MQIWTVCFLLFFVLTQVYQVVQDLSLPLPVMIMGGVLLAIASNVRPTSRSAPSPSQPDPPPSAVPAIAAPETPIPAAFDIETNAATAQTPDVAPVPTAANNPFRTGRTVELPKLPTSPIPPFAPSGAYPQRTDSRPHQ